MIFNTATPIDTATTAQYAGEILQEVQRDSLFVINHSGGKDSQAMYAVITSLVPADQIVVVHADLRVADWAYLKSHIRENTDHDLAVVAAKDAAGNDKDFLTMVEARHEKLAGSASPWPSPSVRQCTSDLKRTPIESFIKAELKRRGLDRAINCMGIRAEESANRAKLATWKINKRFNTKTTNRQVIDFLPIFDLTEDEVWKIIEMSGQERHFAYDLGMSRLSCCFCIMGSKADLKVAAKANPELYKRYVELEKKTGFTMMMNEKTLEENTGIVVDQAVA